RKLRIQWHAPFDERQVAGEVFIIRGDHRPDCRGCHRCPCCERRLLGSVEGWVSHREPSSVDFNARHSELGGHGPRSEEHTSELQSRSDLVCRLLLEKKNV